MILRIYEKVFKSKNVKFKYKRSDIITTRLQYSLEKENKKIYTNNKIKVYNGKKMCKLIKVNKLTKKMHYLGEFMESTMSGPKIHDLKRRAAKKKWRKEQAKLKRLKEKQKKS